MTQFNTQSPVLPAIENDGITNAREIVAFVVAELVKLGATYALTFAGLLSPLYLWAFHAGGRPGFFAVSAGLSVIWGVVVFGVFILARGLFGGVPTLIGDRGQGYAVTTRGGEIGAFTLAYAMVIAVVLLLNALVLAAAYVALGPSLAPLLGLAISVVGAIIVFVAFIGLRQALVNR